MQRELLISAGPGEWRAALLEAGVPVELYVERGDRSEVGSIHLGRVRRLVPSLGATLVDIGSERPAFLPQSAVVPRGKRLHEGERVVVQIRREAQGGKAARATMATALRGQHVELIVGRPGLDGVEALSLDERGQLLATIDAITRPILRIGSTLSRAAGEGAAGLRLNGSASLDALIADAENLVRQWGDVLDRAATLDPPTRLGPIPAFSAGLAGALLAMPSQIRVDDPATIPEIRAGFPNNSVDHFPESEWPIDLDEVFVEALSQTSALREVGSVHFEATRAGVLIDVDSGTADTGSPERTGLATNFAAAAAIARQIRLRNLGGAIIVDFVGLDSRVLREKVRAALSEALAPDPANPRILGWTRLGHLELVRPRRGRPLAEALLEPHPGGALVKMAVAVAHEALRALRREARAQPGRQWRLIVVPEVAAALAGSAAPAMQDAERRFARKIVIEADPGYDRERFQITPL